MLTKRQAWVLTTIKSHVAAHGSAPTLNELCEYAGTTSAGSMSKHVAALTKLGFLTRSSQWRGIILKERCPCCGQKMIP